ncbi:lysozyme [Paenochrobactrum gallinarii]|uniref:Lysozyme n=1 Tax=Paenochrobactrum gallinarii TaxID=643673 RepID=A0A841LTG5_9HYPH|nr:GH25 family lysozyme [Paenochrobactrum gallinarii]MBB6259842.1 lysozyme [Paenochrobactrum gallinarii]
MKRLAVTLTFLASAALLSGCTTVDYDFSDVRKPSAQNSQITPPSGNVRAPRFGDRKPHEWAGKTPWHYPIHGTDVSKYQTTVDWNAARKSGISFAFIKATEGGDRFDERFTEHWGASRAAHVKRGAYHFYYFCRTAADQARWFIKNVPNDPSALPPVLDMEWNASSPTCKLRPNAAIVRKEMLTFLNMVEKHYGKRPIIYTTVDFFDDNDLRQLKHYPFWLRSTAGHPDEKYGPHPWTFWQYTGTGSIPGISGDADINVFAGDASAWKKWLESNNVR